MSEVKVTESKKHAPFVMPEDVPASIVTDPSRVEGLPKKYIPRWVNKSNLPSNRFGVWVAVDKTHPEFKDVRVSRDDTPKETVFTRGDVVLCVTHKDTYKQVLKRRKERNDLAFKSFDRKDKDKLKKIEKDGLNSIKTAFGDEDEDEKE